MTQTSGPKPEQRTFWYTAARALTWLITHTFWPVRWHGKENTHLQAPYILVSNHKHWLDPLLVGCQIKRYEVRFLGKKELAESRAAAFLMDKLHMIVVDRHNSDLKAMRDSVKAIREGHVLGIFPEGTRCRDTTMEHLESGCALIALRSGVRLLPALIARPCSAFRVTDIYYGEPIDISDLVAQGISAETAEKLNERIRNAVLSLSGGD